MFKKFLVLMLALTMALCSFSLSAFAAEGNVVFMDVNSGNDSYDGLTADTPKKSFGAVGGTGVMNAIANFGAEGGALVISGKARPGASITFPEIEGTLTITAAWNGVDYRVAEPADNPAAGMLKAAGAISLTLGSDTVITDIILFQEGVTQDGRQNSIIVPAGKTLTITDTVVLMTMPGNDAYWKVVVEEGGKAILSKTAQELLTIENKGTIETYGGDAVELKMTLNQTTYTLNGEQKTMDVAPIIRNERTMLPVRYVAEALGAEIAWDGATSTATLKTADTEIKITVGAATATVNGQAVTLDSPAFIENDRTYMPVRFVAETLGATVAWDGATSTATITK